MTAPFPISPLISGSKEHLEEKVWFTLDAAAPEVSFGSYGVRKPTSGVVHRTRTPDVTHTSIQFTAEGPSGLGGRVAVGTSYASESFDRLPVELLEAVLGLLRSEREAQAVDQVEVVAPVGIPVLDSLKNISELYHRVSVTLGEPGTENQDRILFWDETGCLIGGLLSRVEGLGDEYLVVTDNRFPMLAAALEEEGLLEGADLGYNWKGKTIYRGAGKLLDLTGLGFEPGEDLGE